MSAWTLPMASEKILEFEKLKKEEKDQLIDYLNLYFPPEIYKSQVTKLRNAKQNMRSTQQILDGATQMFPEMLRIDDGEADYLKDYAIVLTAGGEGERLRLSLLNAGVAPETLRTFTKATFPLDNFFRDFGALQVNLCLISHICQQYELNIPVIVTTGPKGSVTYEEIPRLIKRNGYFNLKYIVTVAQDERLHLTTDEKIVCQHVNQQIRPITNPDETGGAMMCLKNRIANESQNCLAMLKRRSVKKILILQGIAIYKPALIYNLAKGGMNHDALGVGIIRKRFDRADPFGSFVVIEKQGKRQTVILEQDIRNAETLELKNGMDYLPYNTGLYSFDMDLLMNMDLPDYATPPKEIRPDLPRAPKVGYAATDIFPLAQKPAVLSQPTDTFGVVKTKEDLAMLADLARKFGLDQVCKKVYHACHPSRA